MPVAVERYLGRRSGPAIAMGTILLFVTAASFVVIDRVGASDGPNGSKGSEPAGRSGSGDDSPAGARRDRP